MGVRPQVLEGIGAGYSHAVIVVLGDQGYPVSVATAFEVDVARGVVRLDPPAGMEAMLLEGRDVNVIFSHIRPLPEAGYDERRYVSVWGPLDRGTDGRLELTPEESQSWDESKVPFFQYSEITVPQAHRYLDALSGRLGRRVRPRLAFFWLALRTTRAPFLTATVIPVLLGVVAAARAGGWSLGLAALTLVGAAFIHLALNVANDVFDTMSGADPANTRPTQFSGGSRVIHYGLVSLPGAAMVSAAFYLGGIAIGLYLAWLRGFWPLFWLGVAGVIISLVYTAPPLRLVHRGVGEIAVGLGFGPIMLLGSYYVQAQRFSLEALWLSLPVGILIALVLYVNEIPDRESDAEAGKRTLPVRWSKEAVIRGFVWSTAAAYALIGMGAALRILPWPTLIALATIPLAVRVTRGIRESYEDPYALMPTMAANIKLHLFTGLLLFAGYLVSIAI
ncbi:MAG TPA: prenyltransferase [Actinomycetota bacterium]|jgi:1,4-dihydroxy-2-naphthoate octaprenyltransferase|nr:prenyltransferase [Actinomycetota bacterium]